MMAAFPHENVLNILFPSVETPKQLSQEPNDPETLSTEYEIAINFSEQGKYKTA